MDGIVSAGISDFGKLLILLSWEFNRSNRLMDVFFRESQQKNDLTGTISPAIGQLTNLHDLWLNRNFIRGIIPTEIALLTNLVTLHVDSTEIEGLVPREIGTMQALRKS